METGVGTSRNINDYPAGVKILGIDWCENILEAALLKPTAGVDIEYKVDDVEKMTFKDNVFDTVVDTFGLEYYVNPKKALQEMKRVCKKDGKILILTSGISNYEFLNYLLDFDTPYYVSTLGYFPNRKWEEIITPEEYNIENFERKMNGTIYFYIIKNTK